MVTAEQRDLFDINGYLHIPDVRIKAELAAAQETLGQLPMRSCPRVSPIPRTARCMRRVTARRRRRTALQYAYSPTRCIENPLFRPLAGHSLKRDA